MPLYNIRDTAEHFLGQNSARILLFFQATVEMESGIVSGSVRKRARIFRSLRTGIPAASAASFCVRPADRARRAFSTRVLQTCRAVCHKSSQQSKHRLAASICFVIPCASASWRVCPTGPQYHGSSTASYCPAAMRCGPPHNGQTPVLAGSPTGTPFWYCGEHLPR